MHISLTFLYACLSLCVLGCCGAPEEFGGGFSFRSRSHADLSSRGEASIENGKLSGDVTGSASGDIDSHLRGGAYAASGSEVIGVNGGLTGKLGGAVQGGLHGEIENKGGAITSAVNSSLNSANVVGLTGHANIATGDEQLRHIAEYEQGKFIERVPTGHGSVTNLGALISVAANVLDNFWLYFWLTLGCIIVLVCFCLGTLCCFYWKLAEDIQGLKVNIESAGNQTSLDHKVNMSDKM